MDHALGRHDSFDRLTCPGPVKLMARTPDHGEGGRRKDRPEPRAVPGPVHEAAGIAHRDGRGCMDLSPLRD